MQIRSNRLVQHTEPPAPTRDRVDVAALGLDIGVIIEDDELRELVRYLWADCASRTTGGDPFVIHVTGREPWRVQSDAHSEQAASLPAAVGAVCAAVNLTVATQTPLLAIHAAVLQKSGTTIVIPGESGAGKTTLTVALLQSGWAYASDEAFALDWRGDATSPYPRPLGVSDWTAEELAVHTGVSGIGERFMRACDFGSKTVTPGFRVDHVLLLDRSEPAGQPALLPIHRAEALEALVRQGFTHPRDPERAIRLLADVVRGAQTWRLSYGDPAQAAQLLHHALAAENGDLRDQSIAECDHRLAMSRETIGGDVSGKRVRADAGRGARSRGALDVTDETG